ncbi:MAG TPA: aerotolerance regulator BatA [Phycisphaerales bacterium]|nr:aerotolerance regulator BatA [Phycisphaerales bacterium]
MTHLVFHWPWALALIALPPLVAWWPLRSRARAAGAVAFSSTDLLAPAGRTLRQRLVWLPPVLRALGLALLCVALARPRIGTGEVRTTARGVALMTVIDRSLSMQLPIEYAGQALSRIDVVKRVFKDFVAGDGRDLKGRPEDLIGLVTFSEFADTVCPLTRVHDTLVTLVDGIELADQNIEQGTAIGDGMALGAARLKKAEEELQRRNAGEADPEFSIKSKALVLLTDGDENRGEMRARDAAELCREWGIKVYAIGIGDERGGTIRAQGRVIPIPRGAGFNERLMQAMAERTGGRYWRADDGESLRRVYEEIDALEKTDIVATEYTSYEEAFAPWASAGLTALGLGLLLGFTWLRRAS